MVSVVPYQNHSLTHTWNYVHPRKVSVHFSQDYCVVALNLKFYLVSQCFIGIFLLSNFKFCSGI